MPTYCYECTNKECKNYPDFEEFHSMSVLLDKCPECGGPTRKLINSMTPGVVELTGKEMVAKIKQDAKKLAKDVYSSEKSYANILGESKYQNLQQRIDNAKRDGRRKK